MRGLRGKTVIVTGGGGAIGRAIGRRFGDEGAVVGVLTINGEAAAQTAESIRQAGGRAQAHAVDITDYAAVRPAVVAGVPQVSYLADGGRTFQEAGPAPRVAPVRSPGPPVSPSRKEARSANRSG